MKKVLLTVVVILVVGGIGWLVISNRDSALPGETISQTQSQKAPDFSLQDFAGKTVRLADFENTPLVINSWAAWCPFCQKELEDFALAQKEFGEQVVIIAVDRAESLQVAKAFTDELGVTNNLIFLLDPQDSFYQAIGGFSMPETIFVNKMGEIAFHKRGPMSLEEIRQRIQQLISQ